MQRASSRMRSALPDLSVLSFTFAGCQRLGRIETEARELTDLTQPVSLVLEGSGVSGIFDDCR